MPRLTRIATVRECLWCAAAFVLAWQLFVPPIVGLSDQGDFARVIGRFGYARQDRATSLSDAYVAAKYVRDEHARVPLLEQPGPEYLFTGAAILLNRLVSPDGLLDIRVMGFVHAAVFLIALWRLFRATDSITACILTAFALTDVGYVAYWNSFYSEPASGIFFLLLLAEGIAICTKSSVSAMQVARCCLWAGLLVIAKPQNFPLAILLIPFVVRIAWRGARVTRIIGVTGAIVVAIAGAFSSRNLPADGAVKYDQIFLAILVESKNPAADLTTFGIDPRYASYAQTGAWTPRTAFRELTENGTLASISRMDIARFYLHRPARMWRRAKGFLPIAFSLRPEWCGNFERDAGFGPGAISHTFAAWSAFHEQVLGRAGRAILILLLASPLAAIVLWIRLPGQRFQIECLALLAIGCLLSFSVAAFGDAWDNVKHCYLFNLQVDACLIACLTMARDSISKRFSRGTQYE